MFERYLTALAPYVVGWYAITSVLDAMFYSLTGLSFFVGGWEIRAGLTIVDAMAAYLMHRVIVLRAQQRELRAETFREVASSAVASYIKFTCSPLEPLEKNRFEYDPAKHAQWLVSTHAVQHPYSSTREA